MITSAQPRIFTQMIIADTQLARQTLTDIEARHYDIMKLELSIEELHEMLLDIARLNESQVLKRVLYRFCGTLFDAYCGRKLSQWFLIHDENFSN